MDGENENYSVKVGYWMDEKQILGMTGTGRLEMAFQGWTEKRWLERCNFGEMSYF